MEKKCVFTERMKYDSCRRCGGENVECPHYLARHYNKHVQSMILRNEEVIARNHSLLYLSRRLNEHHTE